MIKTKYPNINYEAMTPVYLILIIYRSYSVNSYLFTDLSSGLKHYFEQFNGALAAIYILI